MKLKLYRVIGYENGTEPILGAVVATFTGNEKKCTKDAKLWIKENILFGPKPAFKWESV